MKLSQSGGYVVDDTGHIVPAAEIMAEVERLRDDYIRIYHEHYAFMHPGASETVRRADADDFMRRVRALRALRGEGKK